MTGRSAGTETVNEPNGLGTPQDHLRCSGNGLRDLVPAYGNPG